MRVYTEEEARAWLERHLPTWKVQEGHLTRTYITRNWRLSLMVANAIGYLAEAAWHHPDVLITYPRVVVRLRTHEADGITDRDLELAQEIEAVVMWRPQPGAALDGPPERWLE